MAALRVGSKCSRSKENGLLAEPYCLNKLAGHDTRNGPKTLATLRLNHHHISNGGRL